MTDRYDTPAEYHEALDQLLVDAGMPRDVTRVEAIEWVRTRLEAVALLPPGMQPLTEKEAAAAYEEAVAVPLSPERIQEMVDYATGRKVLPPKPLTVSQLARKLVDAADQVQSAVLTSCAPEAADDLLDALAELKAALEEEEKAGAPVQELRTAAQACILAWDIKIGSPDFKTRMRPLLGRLHKALQRSFGDPTLIRVWPFHDAPAVFRDLSPHGGDEDWLAVVPPALKDSYIAWLQQPDGPFGVCDISNHELEDGSTVYIGAHA